MPDAKTALYFDIFKDISILEQLSRSMLEARLPKGMLVSHFSVLNHLVGVRNGQTPQALSSAFQVPKTTMTHTLKGLQDAALIEMKAHEKDRRSKTVWITEAGHAFRDAAITGLAPDFDSLGHKFPPDRAAALGPLLAELRLIMDAERD